MNLVLRSFGLALLMVLSTTLPMGVSTLNDTESIDSTTARSLACSGDICLNEALPNPNGADDATWPGGEWMEIYNSGTSTVDVLDWYLNNKASKKLYFNSASIVGYDAANSSSWEIEPDEYMVVARNGLSNFYLANTDDMVSLYTDGGVQLDQATWTSAASGVSYEEDNSTPTADWIPTSGPSPGAINTGGGTVPGPTVIPSDLVINEVMSNPWPSEDNAIWPGGEWIEVFNSGSNNIDLNGWSVEDAAGNKLDFNSVHLVGFSETLSENVILPGETRMIAINGSGNSGVLNNGVESLTLFWPNGSRAQHISWTDTEAGFSMVESSTSQYWVYAAYPTPNASNPLEFEIIANTPSPIEFAEILSNSSSDGSGFPDGEWIELLTLAVQPSTSTVGPLLTEWAMSRFLTRGLWSSTRLKVRLPLMPVNVGSSSSPVKQNFGITTTKLCFVMTPA